MVTLAFVRERDQRRPSGRRFALGWEGRIRDSHRSLLYSFTQKAKALRPYWLA